jgi:hypothetical protein
MGEMTRQITGVVIAVLAVTAAAYLWQIPQGQWAVVITYSISLLLMFAAVWVIFRRIVRRAYKENGRLTLLPFFLQLLIWGLFFAFPCIYNPIRSPGGIHISSTDHSTQCGARSHPCALTYLRQYEHVLSHRKRAEEHEHSSRLA